MSQDGKPTAPLERSKSQDPADVNLYRRWSRRKSEQRATPETPPIPASSESESATGNQPAQRELTDADMPPLETLHEESDYSGFLSSGVSDSLRKAALKKLFGGKRFNVLDGLDDYADDYTHFEPMGDLVTADMRHQLQRELERLEENPDVEVRCSQSTAVQEPEELSESLSRSDDAISTREETSVDSSTAET